MDWCLIHPFRTQHVWHTEPVHLLVGGMEWEGSVRCGAKGEEGRPLLSLPLPSRGVLLLPPGPGSARGSSSRRWRPPEAMPQRCSCSTRPPSDWGAPSPSHQAGSRSPSLFSPLPTITSSPDVAEMGRSICIATARLKPKPPYCANSWKTSQRHISS